MAQLSIIKRDVLPRGGFAGVRETRLVVPRGPGSRGMGSFVYLADAEFIPHGETGLHPHSDIDIVSVMLRGRVRHHGTLGDGTMLDERTAQTQRSGDGMFHNEVNPDNMPNRMLQIWFLPPARGLAPDYRIYRLEPGAVVNVLGGEGSIDNDSRLDIGLLTVGQRVTLDRPFIVYVAGGEGSANGITVGEGDLLEGASLDFTAAEEADLIIVTRN